MKLPNEFMGIKTEGAYKKYLDKQKKGNRDEERQESSVPDLKNINLADFIQTDITGINGSKVAISKFEFLGMNNLKWKETHFKLNENGLYMPTPEIFMQHFGNVVDDYNGGTKLYDGLGNLLSKDDREDIYKHLTKNHIATYKNEGGDQKGAWSWLNARFVNEDNKWFIEKAKVSGNALKFERSPLEECVREDCYVDLKFNSQGLAVEKSKNQNYIQGENIYFYYPRNGSVARFYADSDRAYLDCDRNPEYSNSSLGVFACAEGTPRKK